VLTVTIDRMSLYYSLAGQYVSPITFPSCKIKLEAGVLSILCIRLRLVRVIAFKKKILRLIFNSVYLSKRSDNGDFGGIIVIEIDVRIIGIIWSLFVLLSFGLFVCWNLSLYFRKWCLYSMYVWLVVVWMWTFKV